MIFHTQLDQANLQSFFTPKIIRPRVGSALRKQKNNDLFSISLLQPYIKPIFLQLKIKQPQITNSQCKSNKQARLMSVLKYRKVVGDQHRRKSVSRSQMNDEKIKIARSNTPSKINNGTEFEIGIFNKIDAYLNDTAKICLERRPSCQSKAMKLEMRPMSSSKLYKPQEINTVVLKTRQPRKRVKTVNEKRQKLRVSYDQLSGW